MLSAHFHEIDDPIVEEERSISSVVDLYQTMLMCACGWRALRQYERSESRAGRYWRIPLGFCVRYSILA